MIPLNGKNGDIGIEFCVCQTEIAMDLDISHRIPETMSAVDLDGNFKSPDHFFDGFHAFLGKRFRFCLAEFVQQVIL